MSVLLNRVTRLALLCSFTFGIFNPYQAFANVGETFGFSSRTRALGGAGAALTSDPSVAYHNPAALGVSHSSERFQLSLGMVYIQPNFKAITNVVTQNTYIADTLRISDVDTSYKPTLGQEVGLSYRLLPDFQNITLGLMAFFPVSQVAYMDSGETYVPEYFLYRARTQRPQVEIGAGGELGKGFYFGAGLHTAFTLTGNATVFLNTAADRISTMRFASSLKPKLSPYLGVMWQPESKNLTFGGVFRFPVASDSTMVLNSAARALGPLVALDFNFTGVSALFYDPMSVELGGSWQMNSALKLIAQLDYQFWSSYQAPAFLIQQPQTTYSPSGSVQISPGSLPSFTYLDILVPRGGVEWEMSDVTSFRAGYAYRPSIISGIPEGAGNYLDPAKHMLNLGVGLKYPHFFSLPNPVRIDLALTYQMLVGFQVTKTTGNEIGNTSDRKIGSPGYEVGGNVLGGGVSLSVGF